ncbi:MAG: 1-phosphofructokinase family hexose kinase [Caulobacteraceae bacterium]|nr:1-phosphofructokinase family hexose kinase [Caulobacteraceae bacterium]
MAGVLTLTVNPAIDLSTAVDRVEPIRKLRCAEGRRDPGGGGVNVARVVRRLGGEVRALYPVGGLVGQLLQRLVEAEGVASVTVPVAGETREDVTVLDRGCGDQYRFVMPGPRLAEAEWRALLDALTALGPGPAIVCASGSLPPGAPDDFYARAAAIVRGWGARFVLDTSGAALKAGLEAGVHLIKPNLRELSELTGAPLADEAARLAACRTLIARGRTEVVALSLGADGALLVTAQAAWRAPALPIAALSTVGAGDSFLGAMVWALAAGSPLDEAFRWAVAGGSAALLAAGTGLCHAEDMRRLAGDVVVEAVPALPAA